MPPKRVVLFATRTAPVSVVARGRRVLERFRGRMLSNRWGLLIRRLKMSLMRWDMKRSQTFPKHLQSCFLSMLGILSIMVVSCGTRTFCHSKRGPRFEAVQSACERHRNVRVLFLLDKLALVLLLTKGRILSSPVLAVIRLIHGFAHRASCYLVFRSVPPEVNYICRGSRFCDADNDPSTVCSSYGYVHFYKLCRSCQGRQNC